MDIQSKTYEELYALRKEVDALLLTKKQEAAEEIRAKMTAMGFNPSDFIVTHQKHNGGGKRYQNPDNPSEVYGGKGRKPVWLMQKINEGRQMEEFLIR